MPRIRILVGADAQSLHPVTANTPHKVSSPLWTGQIGVFLKDFIDEHGQKTSTAYFDSKEREGRTWSIQAHGRFLKEISADDVLFGNVFDRSLNLPYGSGLALQFMKHQDPTLEQDLQSDTPWALSPLVSTVAYLFHSQQPPSKPLPPFPTKPIINDATGLIPKDAQADRRGYFASVENRKSTKLGPSNVVTIDFCHGYLSFSPGLSLTFPVVSFDLMKYWDGRPVRFVCCERGENGPGAMIWCVEFQIVEGDEEPAQGNAGDID